MQYSIYRINGNHGNLKAKKDFYEKINYIVEQYNQSIKQENLTEQQKELATLKPEPIKRIENKGIDIIIYRCMHYSPSSANNILEIFNIKSDTEIYRNEVVWVVTFYVVNNNDLFVTLGGGSYMIVKEYIDWNFGIMLSERIIDKNNSRIISIIEKNITGDEIEQKITYNNKTFFDKESFGKIFKEMLLEISAQRFKTFFPILLPNNLDNVRVTFKSGIKLHRTISADDLLTLIAESPKILKKEPKTTFNDIFRVTDNTQIHELETALTEKLYEFLKNEEESDFDFTISHPNRNIDFFNSDKYIFVDKNSILPENIQLIYENVAPKEAILQFLYKLTENYIKDENTLRGILYNIQLTTSNANNKIITTLIALFQTEIKVVQKSYFHIDTQWYYITDSFIENLNKKTPEILKTLNEENNILPETWTLKNTKPIREGEYNKKYFKNDNYIVLDGIIPQNIELCDIVHITDDTLYLIHVKKGFNRNLRVLASQVKLAAKRLSYSLHSDQKYLKEIYKRLNKNKEYTNKYTEKEFIGLFDKTKRKIKFVFAFAINNSLDTLIKEIKKRSNIAKFSIWNLVINMKKTDFELVFSSIKLEK